MQRGTGSMLDRDGHDRDLRQATSGAGSRYRPFRRCSASPARRGASRRSRSSPASLNAAYRAARAQPGSPVGREAEGFVHLMQSTATPGASGIGHGSSGAAVSLTVFFANETDRAGRRGRAPRGRTPADRTERFEPRGASRAASDVWLSDEWKLLLLQQTGLPWSGGLGRRCERAR